MFMELHREEKGEEGDRGGHEDERGESKGERQIQPAISSLGVLHNPEHRKRFTELGREEKRTGRQEIEAIWWRKRRVQRE